MRFLLPTLSFGLLLAAVSFAPAKAGDAAQSTFSVQGMTCALCGKAISKALYQIEGVSQVEVDQRAERVSVVASAEVSAATLEETIESAGGFEAEPVPSP